MELFKDLEFDTVLNIMADMCASRTVADELLKARPERELKQAEKMLTRTGDAIAVLALHRPNLSFESIGEIIEKAHVGATLSPHELLCVKNNIACLRSLKNAVETTDGCDSLKDITAWVRSCDDLATSIDRAVENDTDLKDSASEKLYNIRRALSRANSKLKERLESFTRQSDISKYLRDNIVTIRGGRYVVPVKSECRSSVKGLVHDVSSSGSTVFIEPFAVVEANNELRTLKTEEQIEVERILHDLTLSVDTNRSELSAGDGVLTECGVIFAKAEYAKKLDAFKPMLNDKGVVSLKAARHPLIDAQKVVPVDIIADKKILLVSGPNTGGKTVVLKTVGLFALMAACGMYLPAAENSEMSLFDEIYCDIGDSQSIEQSLSTFSAHIKKLTNITQKMNERSLVLLDEVGDGTDPEEGAALAIAVIKKILSVGSAAVVTTHFNSVKQFALSCTDISNACMQFDSDGFKPTYKLLLGASGSSYALEIAEALGLGADIIADAKSALSEEKVAFDKIMRETEKLRNDAMRDKIEAEKLKESALFDAEKSRKLKNDYERKLSDINENARNIVRRMADEYSERAELIIEQIKQKLDNADRAALFEARKTAKELSDGVPSDNKKPSLSDAPVDAAALNIGTRVFISGLGQEGTISSKPRGNKVVVAIGSIKTEIPVSSLSIIEDVKKPPKRAEARPIAEPVEREIMLIGYTVDDATAELDRIISDIPPKSTLRIVHGKGTGALGKGIQAYLKRQPRIKTFRYGRYGEGDAGVTIAEVK